MVQVGFCPACQQEVALRDALSTHGDSQLHCPHCNQEFAKGTLSLREVPELRPATAPEKVSGTFSVPADEKVPDTFSPIDMPVVTSSWSRQEYDAQISAQPRPVQAGGSRSFVRQLAGIAGGGVIGLAMGYYILLWIGGPQKDFLEIGRRLPRWAVPAAFHPAQVALQPNREDAQRSLAELLESEESDAPELNPRADLEGLPPEPVSRVDAPPPEATELAVAVLDPPKRTTEDLQAAIDAAADVRLSLVAGELGDPALRPLKSSAYRAFAALAEAVTFAEPTSGREGEHEQLARQARQIVTDTLANERMRGQIGRLAAEWIDAADRDCSGIVAAGLVIGSHMGIAQQRGILVELAGTSRRLAVVGPATIDLPRGATVVVAGSFIDKPQERIRGYTGSSEQVVWAAFVLE